MSATNCNTDARFSGSRAASVRRLTVLYGVLLLAAGLVGWNMNRTWTRLADLQQELAAMEAESYYLGIRLYNGIERLNGMLLQFQLSKDNIAERDRFYVEARKLGALLAHSQPQLATAAERDLAKAAGKAFDAYLTNAAPLLERGLRAVRRDSAALVAEQTREMSLPIRQISERLMTAQKSSWNTFLGVSHRTLGGLWQSSFNTLLLLVILTAVIFWLAHRVTVIPLRQQLSETQAVLERQEKLASLGTLAAGVAHEIRNPLASLKFRLFSLRESLPEEFVNHDDVVVIGDEINRLERIIRDFLQFARPSEPVMGEVLAQQVLQSTHDLLKSQLEARGLQLAIEPGEPAWLRADKQQLEQVLINLVQNAADSIQGRGTVTLRVSLGAARLGNRSTPAVIFEVADTGMGISPEVEPRLFDPFFSTKADGSGLGLPISERIVEKHGGLIQYQTKVNHGTTFQIVLPREDHYVRNHSAH